MTQTSTAGTGFVGSGTNRLGTDVNGLTIDTSASRSHQFLQERDSLTALDLKAGAQGDMDLLVMLGGLSDTDANDDMVGDEATVTTQTSTTGTGFVGSDTNRLGTDVNGLTIDTSASRSSQFLQERNELQALALNAGSAGNMDLVLTAGALQDADGDDDMVGDQARVTTQESGTGLGFVGTSSNRMGTDVNELTVDTSSSQGNQFLQEQNGLEALELNAGATGNVGLALTLGAVSDTDANTDIRADQTVLKTLDSTPGAGAVGTSANPLATQINKLEASSTAGLFLANANALTIGGINAVLDDPTFEGVVAMDDIDILTASGDLDVMETVTSLNSGVTLAAEADNIAISANVSAMEIIDVSAHKKLAINKNVTTSKDSTVLLSAGEMGGFDLSTSAIVSTGDGNSSDPANTSGRVSGTLFLPDVDDVLDGEALLVGFESQVNADGTAKIDITIKDALAVNLQLSIDWRDGTIDYSSKVDAVKPIASEPPTNLDQLNGAVRYTFEHVYKNNPNQANPRADIIVLVTISGLDPRDPGGNRSTDGIQAVEAGIHLPQVTLPVRLSVPPGFLALAAPLPEPEALPAPFAGPPTLETAFEFAAGEPLRGTTLVLATTATSTGAQEERFYQLRIVSLDEHGNLIEREPDRIDLSRIYFDRDKTQFELSELPDLFRRLPDDRYRIYLIEEGAERLVLDFLIRDGRPIEVPQTPEAGRSEGRTENEGGGTDAGGGHTPPTDTPDDQAAAINASVPRVATQLPAAGGSPRQAAAGPDAAGDVLTSQESVQEFATRLGRAAFVAPGGLVLTAAMFSSRTEEDRVREIDQAIRQLGQLGRNHALLHNNLQRQTHRATGVYCAWRAAMEVPVSERAESSETWQALTDAACVAATK
jgi:hypothetical protein